MADGGQLPLASVDRGGHRSGIELRKLRYWGVGRSPYSRKTTLAAAIMASSCQAPRSQRPCTCVLILHARNLGDPGRICWRGKPTER